MKFITTILSTLFCLSMQAQLVTYPSTLSTGMPHNDDYTVRVRIPGGEWKDLFEYNVQVDMDKAIVIEEKLFGDCFETHDQVEGMSAFLEKRKEKNFINK